VVYLTTILDHSLHIYSLQTVLIIINFGLKNKL